MLKYLNIIAFIICFNGGYMAQQSKLNLSVMGGASLSNYSFNPSANLFLTTQNNHIVSYESIGLDYSFKRFNVGLSFVFLDMGYVESYTFILPDLNSNDPFVPEKTTYKYNYISTPIHIGYSLVNKDRFRLISSIGVGGNFHVRSAEKTKFLDGHLERRKGASVGVAPYFMSFPISLTSKHNINDRLGLQFLLQTSLIVTQIHPAYQVQTSWYSSLLIGVYYRIKQDKKE